MVLSNKYTYRDKTKWAHAEHDCRIFDDEDESGNSCYSGELINALADYEDLDENGLLFKKPCKVGDTIYRIESSGKGKKKFEVIIEAMVDHIVIGQEGYALAVCDADNNWGDLGPHEYNEGWFTDRNLAEEQIKQQVKTD